MTVDPISSETDSSNGEADGESSAAAPAPDKMTRRISGELHHFLAEIEQLLVQVASLTGEDPAQALAKLGQHVDAARDSVKAMGGAMEDQTRKGITLTNDYVHDQPWRAIGVGAGIGFALGFALARRT